MSLPRERSSVPLPLSRLNAASRTTRSAVGDSAISDAAERQSSSNIDIDSVEYGESSFADDFNEDTSLEYRPDKAGNDFTDNSSTNDVSADNDAGSYINDNSSTNDVNARENKLWTAIRCKDLPAVTRLLDEGVSLTCRDMLEHTPLHLSVLGSAELDPDLWAKERKYEQTEIAIMRKILEKIDQSDNKTDILESVDVSRLTPLYYAIYFGSVEVVQLLIEHGASVDNVSELGGTALHAAVCHPEVLKYLLNRYNIKITGDRFGYTALHRAAQFNEVESLRLLVNKLRSRSNALKALALRNNDGSTVFHVAASHDSVEIVEFALNFISINPTRDVFMNMRNNNGETAFIVSIKECNREVAALLLRKRAAALSEKDGDGRTAIEHITKHIDNPLIFLENVLDESISLMFTKLDKDNARLEYKRSEIYVSYDNLTNSNDMSQIQVIEEIVRFGQKKLLIHPVIESLLFLKWTCLLPVICTLIAIYAVFLGSFNVFIVTTFNRRDSYNASACGTLQNETNAPCFDCFIGWRWMWITMIYICIFLLLVQECGYISLQKLHYFCLVEPWLKLCLFALAAVVTLSVSCAEPAAWLRHAASAALLLSWLEAVLLLSRFPDWGYYVLMIERVAYNVFKVLLTAVCLLFGFSFSFMIEFHSLPPFDDPGAAFVKTLVMMSSEFDYGTLFDDDHAKWLQDTKPVFIVLFVIFVIFIAIVLMNFMIGIAVSDINALNVVGNIRRLEKQVELQSSLIDSPLVKLIVAIGDLTLSPFCKLSNEDRCNKNSKSFDLDLLDPNSKERKGLLRIYHYQYKIEKRTESDKKWRVYFGKKPYRITEGFSAYVAHQTLATDLHNAIINVGRKNVQRDIDDQLKTKQKNDSEAVSNSLSSVKEKIDMLETSILNSIKDINDKLGVMSGQR